MQYTAIAKDGGLFIPNLHQFSPNQIIKINVQGFEYEPANLDSDDENCDDLIGILKGVDGVEFQNALREE